MTRMPILGAIAAFALLGACSGEAPTANIVTIVETDDANVVVPGDNGAAPVTENVTDAHAAPALKLASDGLVLLDVESGVRKSVRFGQPRDQAVPAVAAALSKPVGQSVNQECGAGPLEFVEFQGRFSMLFQDGKFAGWSLDGREGGGYATEAGLGIGTARSGFGRPVKVEESTLGQEFDFDGIGGLLDGTGAGAKVTNLWAGTTCMFR